MKFNTIYLSRSSSFVAAFLLSVIFVSTSCGLIPGKDSDATIAEDGGSGTGITGAITPLQAYENGLYAMMTTPGRANCAQCHNSTDSPFFAIPNNPLASCQALIAATGSFSLRNASSSTVATYFATPGAGSCLCTSAADCNSGAFQSAVQQWWGATQQGALDPCSNVTPTGSPTSTPGSSCAPGLVLPTGVAYVTQPMVIPSPLPSASGTTGTILNFNLASTSPVSAGISGVFQIQAQQLSATTYSIIAPRMAVPVATDVGAVHVLLQRQGQGDVPCEFPAGETWTGVSTTVAASTVPNPVSTTTALTSTVLSMSNAPMPILLSLTGVPEVMDISIGFGALAPFQAINNPNAKFSYIQTNVLTPTCVSCHGASGGFSFANYASTVKAVTPFNPTTSQLYTAIAAGGTMPEGGTPLTATFQQAIHDWIANGALNN